jgi:AhpD family alkylhydroperoxidase
LAGLSPIGGTGQRNIGNTPTRQHCLRPERRTGTPDLPIDGNTYALTWLVETTAFDGYLRQTRPRRPITGRVQSGSGRCRRARSVGRTRTTVAQRDAAESPPRAITAESRNVYLDATIRHLTGAPLVTEPMYHPTTPEIAARRKELAPEIHDAFEAFGRAVFADGALPKKTKQLIAVAVAHTTQCPYCIQGHTRLAVRTGASPREIMEAVWVAAEMRAGGAYAHSTLALHALAPMVTGREAVR